MRNIIALVVVLLLAGQFYLLSQIQAEVTTEEEINVGSVEQGHAFYSTTTDDAWLFAKTLKAGPGSLAQVTITKAGAGGFTLYNATTTNVNKRTGNLATSTLVLGVIPASPTVGTYIFDSTFTDGLLLDPTASTHGTSTIMWR